MRRRLTLTGLAVVAVVVLSAGLAFAVGGDTSPATTGATTMTAPTTPTTAPTPGRPDPATGHGQMHAQMPPEAQARCQAMHAQMGEMGGSAGGMTGTTPMPASTGTTMDSTPGVAGATGEDMGMM